MIPITYNNEPGYLIPESCTGKDCLIFNNEDELISVGISGVKLDRRNLMDWDFALCEVINAIREL